MDHDDSRERPPSPVNGLEAEAARLRERYPGWHVWYVRNAPARTVAWCASPSRYPLIADGPGELAAAIDAEAGEAGE